MNARVFMPVDKAAFDRFLAKRAEGRFEFVRGRIVEQVTEGTHQHFRLAKRIDAALSVELDENTWEIFRDWEVSTPETVRFGDVVVFPTGGPARARWTEAPSLIVEVLSPRSVVNDLDAKPSEYLALGTLQAYIVASQDEAACLAWVRSNDGSFPTEPVGFRLPDTIKVPSLGVALPLADIYRGIDLQTQDPTSHG